MHWEPFDAPQALGIVVRFLEGVLAQLLAHRGIGVSLEQVAALELDRETFLGMLEDLGQEKRGQN